MVRTIRAIIKDQDPFTVSATITVSEAAGLMRERRIGAAMVVEEGKLVGLFTERDALFRVVAQGLDPHATRLAQVMTRDVHTIHPDKLFGNALQIMQQGGFRHVPVVEDGKPVGMVSARDALGPELEDFVLELLRQEQAQDILA